MQKFCNQCGRPLEEGEVCVCQQGSYNQYRDTSNSGMTGGYAGASNQGVSGSYTNMQGQGMSGGYSNMSGQRTSGGYSNMQGQGTSGGYSNMQGQRMSGGYTNMQGQGMSGGYTNMQGQGMSGGYTNMQGQTGANPYAGQQMTSRLMNRTRNIFANILPILRDPVGETREITYTGDGTLGMEMVIFHIAVTVILTLLSMIVVRMKLGDYAEMFDIPYLKIIFSVTLLDASGCFATAGLLLLTSKIFFKAETSFGEIISVTGTKALLEALLTVCSIAVFLISKKAGVIFLLVGMLYTTLMFLFSYAESIELDGSKKVYSLLITYIGLAVMYYLLSKMFLDDTLSYFNRLF